MKKAIAAALALILVACGSLTYLATEFVNTPASSSAEIVVFEIEPGLSFKTIAKRLESQGLVTSATKTALFARFTGEASKVRVGEYAIPRRSTPSEVLKIISSGRSIERPVTIAEGLNMYDVADIVERAGVGSAKDFLAICRDREFVREQLGEDLPSLEGYLFPETYLVTKFTGLKGLAKMMVARFKDVIKQTRQAPGVKLTRHQLVTLASIVEKETGAPEERPVISSVFHNRLRLGMKLQTDPTVMYGVLDQIQAPIKNITRQHLRTDTRYNTYTRVGLPYGPISNPGKLALQAAGTPESTDFLYFVSRNDGTHVFSRDYAGHQRAVESFQLNRAARESGSSWRDLQGRTREDAAKHTGELKAPARVVRSASQKRSKR